MLDRAALQEEARAALRASHDDEARRHCEKLIAAHPSFADGYFLLAICETRSGLLSRAEQLFAHAVRLAPQAGYLAHQAKCLAQLRKSAEALRAADRACEMGPADALTLDTLACVYSRLGAHEKALPLFEKAVEQQPQHSEMRYNLASSLSFSGRSEEAAAHFEAIIATAPGFVKAHTALSRLRKQSREANHVARLEALLPHNHDSVDSLHIHHALAKEYEDLEEYERAFGHLDHANRQRKAQLGYHIDMDQATFERLMRAFAQPEYFPGESAATAAPIFIIGMPRTGTTLTDRILSSHPAIESAGELQAMPLAVRSLAGGPSRRALDPETIDLAGKISPSGLGQAYLEYAAPHRRSGARFIDKLPLNFLYVGFIARALPHARIVCLRRHPLDTIWSNYKHLFATGVSYYNYSLDLLDTAAYYAMFDRLMKLWQQLFPGRILELQYEAIVEDLAGQVGRLLKHCGLPWCDACLRFQENHAPVATPSSAQVRQPLYGSSVGRWHAYQHHLAPVIELLRARGIAL